MNAAATRRGAALSMLRRAARRARSRLAAARAHPTTSKAFGAGRRALDRAALAWRGRRGRAARAAEWDQLVRRVAARPVAPRSAASVSIVMIATDAAPTAQTTIGQTTIGQTTIGQTTIGSGTIGATDVGELADVEVVAARPEPGESAAAAAARVTAGTRGELLCFMSASSTALERGWLTRLAAAVGATTAAAAAPLVVHPLRAGWHATPHDGRVRARGVTVAVAEDAPGLRAEDAGAVVSMPASDPTPAPVAGATAACLLVRREAYDAAGALPDFQDIDLAVFELCRRLRARGDEVVVVPSAVIVDHRPVTSLGALLTPIPTRSAEWHSYVEAHGAELMRGAQPLPPGRLRIALTVAAPSAKVAPRWGDWHLAQAFARGLRGRGHVVRVQTLDHADDLAGRACDVHCVVRGLSPVRRTAGQAHVLWVISHPEELSTAECDDADLVLVASTRFADELRARTSTPVEVMLQATDVTRFRPVPPLAIHEHDVAVVAKSRDVFRTSVADAIAGGTRPAIYGSGWEPFVDPTLVVSQYLANEELPVVYSSVGVLLNDHWQTMHEWGFVSNRLFDALACETPVISDDLPELAELFDGAVLTYRDTAELQELIASTLADRPAARARAARGRELVAGRHTFDHRAAQFLDALARHGLVP